MNLRGYRRAKAWKPLGEAEVGELERAAVAGDEDVGGLEVAVHHNGLQAVQVLEGLHDVQRPGLNLQNTVVNVLHFKSRRVNRLCHLGTAKVEP